MTSEWEGVRSFERVGDGSVKIVATVVDMCGSAPVGGSYSVQGDAIALSYERHGPHYVEKDGKKMEVVAACNCVYTMTYEIAHVAPGVRRAQIRGTGMGVP